MKGDHILSFLFLLLLNTVVPDDPENPVCVIDVLRDIFETKWLPVTIINPVRFIYPRALTPSTIQIRNYSYIRVLCGNEVEYLTCRKKQLMWRNGTDVQLNEVCKEKTLQYSTTTTKRGCPTNVECLAIGFRFNLSEFRSTIDRIILSPNKKRPLWAHTIITPVIDHRQKDDEYAEYNEYETSEFFNGMLVNMEEVYDKDYQKTRLANILGDEGLAEKYISDEGPTIFQPGGDYLVQGLLIHNKDLFYKEQQKTVYHYANVMPMWKSIVVSGNWNLSGEVVRKIASYTNDGLNVWSGTIDTLEFEDIKSVKKKIHLAVDESGEDIIPVPKLLFKYVYDQIGNRGIVLLTINNPYLKKLTADYVLCKNLPVCHQLYPRFTIFQIGYTYCCSLRDFAAIAKRRGMPPFPNAHSIL